MLSVKITGVVPISLAGLLMDTNCFCIPLHNVVIIEDSDISNTAKDTKLRTATRLKFFFKNLYYFINLFLDKTILIMPFNLIFKFHTVLHICFRFYEN